MDGRRERVRRVPPDRAPQLPAGILSTAIFSFLLAWNDYLIALLFLQDSTKYNAAHRLNTFFQQNAADWGAVMAVAVIMMLPPVLLFVFLNKYFSVGGIGGSLAGASSTRRTDTGIRAFAPGSPSPWTPARGGAMPVPSPTIRAAVDRIIPPDSRPGGWEGGVAAYFADSPDLGWADDALARLDARLAELAGGTGFAELPPERQDELLTAVAADPEGAHDFAALRRVVFEGYYAAREGASPAGLALVGFRAVPEGVEPVEPDLVPDVGVGGLRRDYDAIVVGSGPAAASPPSCSRRPAAACS